jgi:hypothetical protein
MYGDQYKNKSYFGRHLFAVDRLRLIHTTSSKFLQMTKCNNKMLDLCHFCYNFNKSIPALFFALSIINF